MVIFNKNFRPIWMTIYFSVLTETLIIENIKTGNFGFKDVNKFEGQVDFLITSFDNRN